MMPLPPVSQSKRGAPRSMNPKGKWGEPARKGVPAPCNGEETGVQRVTNLPVMWERMLASGRPRRPSGSPLPVSARDPVGRKQSKGPTPLPSCPHPHPGSVSRSETSRHRGPCAASVPWQPHRSASGACVEGTTGGDPAPHMPTCWPTEQMPRTRASS